MPYTWIDKSHSVFDDRPRRVRRKYPLTKAENLAEYLQQKDTNEEVENNE